MMREIVGGVVREGFGRLRIIVNYVHDFLGDAKGGHTGFGDLDTRSHVRMLSDRQSKDRSLVLLDPIQVRIDILVRRHFDKYNIQKKILRKLSAKIFLLERANALSSPLNTHPYITSSHHPRRSLLLLEKLKRKRIRSIHSESFSLLKIRYRRG